MGKPDFNDEQRAWIARYRLYLLTVLFADVCTAGAVVFLAMLICLAYGFDGAGRVFSNVLWGVMLACAVVLWRKYSRKGVQS